MQGKVNMTTRMTRPSDSDLKSSCLPSFSNHYFHTSKRE